MAGLYIHIPFCHSRCAYCDFYSTTRESELAAYVDALCHEIADRSHELSHARVHTIYIGGGTPSLLNAAQLATLFETIHRHYSVVPDAEVTLEVNPDDVAQLAPDLPALGINRVSMGIQTFDDELLQLIRRRHNAQTALQAVRQLQDQGIQNISIDLIYGLPGQTMELWLHDLDVTFTLGVQHLSAYSLSYEEGTPLSHWRDEGRILAVTDELAVEMYSQLCERARKAGFQHYEISNFALPDHRSRHNSSYWTGIPYLGFGPAAHSYDGSRTRRANLPDLTAYLDNYETYKTHKSHKSYKTHNPHPPYELESLSQTALYNEAVMCGLRTCEGICLSDIATRFGQKSLDYLLQLATPHLSAGHLIQKDGHLRLAEAAIMVSDDIMSDLMQ